MRWPLSTSKASGAEALSARMSTRKMTVRSPGGRSRQAFKTRALAALRLREALGAQFVRQAVGRSAHELGVALQGLVGQPPDRAGNAERADDLASEIHHRDCDTAHFGVEFAIVEGDSGAPDFLDLLQEHGRIRDRILGRRFQLDTFKGALQLIGTERGQYDLAERRAMHRPDYADELSQLKRAGAGRA